VGPQLRALSAPAPRPHSSYQLSEYVPALVIEHGARHWGRVALESDAVTVFASRLHLALRAAGVVLSGSELGSRVSPPQSVPGWLPPVGPGRWCAITRRAVWRAVLNDAVEVINIVKGRRDGKTGTAYALTVGVRRAPRFQNQTRAEHVFFVFGMASPDDSLTVVVRDALGERLVTDTMAYLNDLCFDR